MTGIASNLDIEAEHNLTFDYRLEEHWQNRTGDTGMSRTEDKSTMNILNVVQSLKTLPNLPTIPF